MLDDKALDPRIRWLHVTGAEVHSSPTVADGVVYVGCDEKKV
ncbi:PQQ-binding-like beta-propeller repeat protein [Streptomyces sp. M10(2022)]